MIHILCDISLLGHMKLGIWFSISISNNFFLHLYPLLLFDFNTSSSGEYYFCFISEKSKTIFQVSQSNRTCRRVKLCDHCTIVCTHWHWLLATMKHSGVPMVDNLLFPFLIHKYNYPHIILCETYLFSHEFIMTE